MNIILVANLAANGVVQRMEQIKYYQASMAVSSQAISKAVECGALIVGRKTYEMLAGMEQLAEILKSITVIVLTTKHIENVTTAQTPEDAVRLLADARKGSAVVAGGVACYNAFLGAGLVNEMYIGIMPVMLQGDRLEITSGSLGLSLKESICLDEQTVQLHYALS